ncbi:MAG: sodium-coupled permease [Pirellulales bacterium]|nr:sodium-coupled permease [Pirellulales bacterium]
MTCKRLPFIVAAAFLLLCFGATVLAGEAPTPGDDIPRESVTGGVRNVLTTLDWIVIVAYGVGMLAVGWYYWRQNQTSEDYLLGGRAMRPLAVGLSLFATLFSTISYLAWPGEMIKNGPMILSMIVAYPFVALVVGWFMIPYIMRLKITSAYELLETRLGLSVRMLGSTLFLLLRILWMAMIIYATVDTVLVPLIGMDSSASPYVAIVLGVVTLVYTAMGGLKAVVVTDVLQGLILFAGAIVSIIMITIYLGGVTAWWPTGWAAHWTRPVFYDPNLRISFLSASLATFAWYIATSASDQMAIQRYLATRDAAAARRVLNTSLIANTLVFFLLAALGLALLAFFKQRSDLLAPGQSLVENADQMFTRFIVVGLPSGLSGLVVAGLLAAAMSSLSAGINSSCSVITADFIDRFGLRRTDGADSRKVLLEQILSAGIGVLVLVLSTFVGMVQGNLLDKTFKVVNLLPAPLFGLFFMAMFIPWATGFGTWIGALAGLAVVVSINFWQFWHELFGLPEISFFWAMPVCIIVQAIVGPLASLLPIGKSGRKLEELVQQS